MMKYATRTTKKSANPVIQTKLQIGQPGDKYEQEADAMADQVMRITDSNQMQMQPMEEEEEMMQPKLRMQPMEEEEEMMQPKLRLQPEEEEEMKQPIIQMQAEEEEEMLQPKSMGDNEFASTSITNEINSSKGNGSVLRPETSQLMSNLFGSDFSNVRIHTGTKAEQMSQNLNAKAFTYRNNIYFNKSEYNPNGSEGRRLLAHELTHVVQQNGEVGKKINSKGQKVNSQDSSSQFKSNTAPEIQKDGGLTVGIIGLLVSVGAFAVGQGGSNPLTVDPRLERIATPSADRETYRTSHPFRNKSWSFFNGSWPTAALDRQWEVDLRWQHNGSELTDVRLVQGYRQFSPFCSTHAKLIMVDNQASNKKIGFRCEFDWDPWGPGDSLFQCDGWISADGSAHRSDWRRHDY